MQTSPPDAGDAIYNRLASVFTCIDMNDTVVWPCGCPSALFTSLARHWMLLATLVGDPDTGSAAISSCRILIDLIHIHYTTMIFYHTRLTLWVLLALFVPFARHWMLSANFLTNIPLLEVEISLLHRLISICPCIYYTPWPPLTSSTHHLVFVLNLKLHRLSPSTAFSATR